MGKTLIGILAILLLVALSWAALRPASVPFPSVRIKPRKLKDFPDLTSPVTVNLPDNYKVSPSFCTHMLEIFGSNSEVVAGEKRIRSIEIFTHEGPRTSFLGEIFVNDRLGARVRQRGGEYHRDQILSSMGVAGVLSSTPIELHGSSLKVSDFIEYTMYQTRKEQPELAWTLLALIAYTDPPFRWVNRFGESISIEDLVTQILENGFQDGSCGGLHRLQAIAIALNIGDSESILSPETRTRCIEFLTAGIEKAVEQQLPDGSWPGDWNTIGLLKDNDGRNSAATNSKAKTLITAHMLDLNTSLGPTQKMPGWRVELAEQFLAEHYAEIKDRDSFLIDFCPNLHLLGLFPDAK